ncbi:MAG: hypothetical protein EOP04_22205, partial [Proteobacteria bacterium]
YEENINALYVNYNRPFKGFVVQAGLRAENTNITGTSIGQKELQSPEPGIAVKCEFSQLENSSKGCSKSAGAFAVASICSDCSNRH